jgi:four helix bundle protein
MATKSFEETELWQDAMGLCTNVYKITNKSGLDKDFGLKDQIRRSAVSVPSNISEGFERGSNKQLIYFLYIAKGSCGELRTQIQIAYNLEYVNHLEFTELTAKTNSISKQIAGFIKYLEQNPTK